MKLIIILHLLTIMTVTAANITHREAELVWQAMWEQAEKEPVIEQFEFDAGRVEFKAKLRRD